MKMKRLILISLIACILVPQVASAGSNADGFGLGIIVGEPTGLSVKWWSTERSAFQAAAAWSFSSDSNFHFHLDYIFHRFDLFDLETGRLPLYYGIGGRFRVRENADDDLGLRVPIGINYMFANDPFDIFVEVVPILDLVPDTDFDLNAAIGGRWYF
jgi:hypothetical protein